jgi:hypothetical protein
MGKNDAQDIKGFIYNVCDKVICYLWYLNPVKYFRDCAIWLNKDKSDRLKETKYKLNAIDSYIILKWLAIIFITLFKFDCYFFTFFKWYLIAANLHSFFYYFIWKEIDKSTHSIHRQRRRLIHLFQAVFFSHLTFASLYYQDYASELSWHGGKTFLKAFWLSVSNSVGGNYEVVLFQSDNAHSVMMIQYMMTFLFVGILISKAIPDYKT